MSLLRQRSLRVGIVALFTAAAACSSVLGLDAPKLDPCANGGCADASPAVIDGSPAPDGSDSSVTDAPAPDAGTDAKVSTFDGGIRCGFPGSDFGCAPPEVCCLVLDDAGVGTYSCTSSASTCPGYPIACATNNDCSGSDVCCFYQSAIKCEPVNTASCQNGLVCDPSNPGDTCATGQKCDVAFILDGYTLPYDGCQ